MLKVTQPFTNSTFLERRAKWQKFQAHLPGQEEQQSPGGTEGSEQARWQGTFSQLTSPS